MKKYKEEWWEGAKRHRIMHDLLPNLALEKLSLLGAGLMWKRMYAASTGIRPTQKKEGDVSDTTPWKALPLTPVWDKMSVPTYHKEFSRQHGESVLTDVNGLTSLDMTSVDESLNFGLKIRPMDHPYLLSPPRVPVTGATRTSKDTVKVMAFHGIVYSHQGLSDPAVMPEYVHQVREAHCGILRYATLEPELPKWSVVRRGLSSQHWDLGGPTQAYSKPTGREKSMVYNDQASKWEKAPVPEKLPEPEKGKSAEKEKNVDKAAQLKRRSETETDEPKAKKGSIANATGKVKTIELKPASEVSKASREKSVEGAGKADEPATGKSEKRPHTPRSGIVLRKAEEVQQQDAGEKTPHGDSSDDADDVVLAENLQKASSVAWTSRKGMEGSDGPRSDEVLYGDAYSEHFVKGHHFWGR